MLVIYFDLSILGFFMNYVNLVGCRVEGRVYWDYFVGIDTIKNKFNLRFRGK